MEFAAGSEETRALHALYQQAAAGSSTASRRRFAEKLRQKFFPTERERLVRALGRALRADNTREELQAIAPPYLVGGDSAPEPTSPDGSSAPKPTSPDGPSPPQQTIGQGLASFFAERLERVQAR